MACEDCLEVGFVGLVVQRICVWCPIITDIFMGFGQTGAKRCGRCLKVVNWGWRCKLQKGASLHREGRFSLCNTAVLWNFVASLTGYILQKILLDTSFHYATVVLRVWGLQSQKCNSDCPNEKLNGLFQKNFQVFNSTHENSLSLTLLISSLFFFHYNICTVISDCNHPSFW